MNYIQARWVLRFSRFFGGGTFWGIGRRSGLWGGWWTNERFCSGLFSSGGTLTGWQLLACTILTFLLFQDVDQGIKDEEQKND